MSVHDLWNGARKGPGKRWQVRWREGGRQHKRRFASREAADQEDAKHRLGIVEPDLRRARFVSVDELMATWLSTTGGLEQATQTSYRTDANQVLATFGGRAATSVLPSEVRAWVGRRHPGVSIRRRSLGAMRRAYQLAIADGLLSVDPTAGATLPAAQDTDMRILTWDELERLADASRWPALIWVLGTCGVRLSEAVALNGEDVDRGRRRLWVGKTKTKKPRDVPVMKYVVEMLPNRPGPVFRGAHGGRLNAHNWRERDFHAAAEAAGLLPLHPHLLRHTAASLAIASGADIKVIQRMLGHKTTAMTLDRYGHLMDSQLDLVAVRMDRARRAHRGRTANQKGAKGAPTPLHLVPVDSTPAPDESAPKPRGTRRNTG